MKSYSDDVSDSRHFVISLGELFRDLRRHVIETRKQLQKATLIDLIQTLCGLLSCFSGILLSAVGRVVPQTQSAGPGGAGDRNPELHPPWKEVSPKFVNAVC